MSDAKFAAAKELIQEKHYDEARGILKTIDDQRAEEWLKKLKKYPVKRARGAFISWIITGIAVIIAAISITLWVTGTRPPEQLQTQSDQLSQVLKGFCANYGMTGEKCDEEIAKYSGDEIQGCYEGSGNGKEIAVFAQCMYIKSFRIDTKPLTIDAGSITPPALIVIRPNDFIHEATTSP